MVKKIAVLRANALGDYIFVLPALQALREKYPDSEIVYLGRSWHKEYIEERPGPVDRVIVVPPYPGISEREGFDPSKNVLDEFFAQMQEEQFDIAFQLHGGGRNSNPFLLQLGAKLTVGLRTPDAAELDISVPYIYYMNEVLRYLEVVSYVGAKTADTEPKLHVTASDLEEANAVVDNPENKPIAVIHPGASDIRRRWPGANFAKIADFFVERGYHVCISGLTWERGIIDGVLSYIVHKDKVQDISGKLSLSGTTGLLSFADILISNDTGPLHVARALKTPTVGLYWCGNMITAAPISTALNRSLLSWTLHCPLCGLSTSKFNETDSICTHQTSLIDSIPVNEVKATIKELLHTAEVLSEPGLVRLKD